MQVKPTQAQRRLLEHVAAHSGQLRSYMSRRDFPVSVCRRDTLLRTLSAGWLEPPRLTPTWTYELTPTGRAALDQGVEKP
jgi:hypothetical protein